MKKVVIMIAVFLLFGCEGNHRQGKEKLDLNYKQDEGEWVKEADELEMLNIQLTGIIETCNKCKGYGMVQDGFYGTPQICKFCWVSTWMRIQNGWTGFDGRYGQVDAVFNTLPADYFDGLDWNAGGMDDDDELIRDQIEAEIERHEENIAQMEQMLEYIDGSVNRMQLQQRIIEEQYEIMRLRQILDQ